VVGSVATSLIDISDGLSSELSHLTYASECGAKIQRERIPYFPQLQAAARACDRDLSDWVLHGGEDYELLFSIADGVDIPDDCTVIGHAIEEREVILVEEDGTERPLDARGYNHFVDS
jgi:thiamine-monophosphate kinase